MVVASGVELLGEPVVALPPNEAPPEVPLLVEPVLGPPIELVLPAEPVLPVVLLLDPEPAVLPVLGLVAGGLVLLLDEVEPVPELAPPVPAPLLQALRDSAATTASVARASWEKEVFIGETPRGL